MPGLLRPDAACPFCGRSIIALVDTTHSHRNGKPPQIAVTREYFHGPRAPMCTATFKDYKKAHRERFALEIHP